MCRRPLGLSAAPLILLEVRRTVFLAALNPSLSVDINDGNKNRQISSKWNYLDPTGDSMKSAQQHRYPTQRQSQSRNEIKQGDRLLSSIEVASIIGKSTAWLARKRWEGDGIPYRKIGRHVRYQESVVMDWLNSQPQLNSTSE